MINLSLIAAIGKNNELGYKNDLIWRFKEDLAFFKEQTTGSYIIMGKNTYHSMPKKLPERKYIVLSTDENFFYDTGLLFRNLPATLNYIKNFPNKSFYIVGGGQIYNAFLPYVARMFLTEINATFPAADTFFPKFNQKDWNQNPGPTLTENNTTYKHVLYYRKDQ